MVHLRHLECFFFPPVLPIYFPTCSVRVFLLVWPYRSRKRLYFQVSLRSMCGLYQRSPFWSLTGSTVSFVNIPKGPISFLKPLLCGTLWSSTPESRRGISRINKVHENKPCLLNELLLLPCLKIIQRLHALDSVQNDVLRNLPF